MRAISDWTSVVFAESRDRRLARFHVRMGRTKTKKIRARTKRMPSGIQKESSKSDVLESGRSIADLGERQDRRLRSGHAWGSC